MQAPSSSTNDLREEKRLSRYGLKPTDALAGSLVVAAGKRTELCTAGGETPPEGLLRLEPKSLDDVKQWIGVPDELGAKRACSCEMPAEVPGVSSASELRELDTNSRRAIRNLAQEYVHGDSRRVAAYAPILDLMVDRAYLHGWFFREDIDIYNGAVLEIGGAVRILFARHIRIWVGGELRITGDATIDCVSITGDYQGPMPVADIPAKFAAVERAALKELDRG